MKALPLAVALSSIALALALCAGCAGLCLTEKGLVVGKDTTATIDDVGVARVTKGF